MPLGILKQLERNRLADLSRLNEGIVEIDSEVSGVPDGVAIPCPQAQYDLEMRAGLMDDSGTDVQVLSIPPFLLASTSEDPVLVEDVVAMSNEILADTTSEAGPRFFALGAAPVGQPFAAMEAERCLHDLEMAGLAIGSFGGGVELDHAVNSELWELARTEDAFILLHPSRVSGIERLGDYHLPQLLGYPTETALAASRLVFGGVIDRFSPNICLAHGGGCLTGLISRLDLGWRRKKESQTIDRRPSSYLSSFFFDTAVFSTRSLTRLIEDVGTSNVLVGTDAPFDLADTNPRETVDALEVAEDDHRAILSGNAAVLLGI